MWHTLDACNYIILEEVSFMFFKPLTLLLDPSELQWLTGDYDFNQNQLGNAQISCRWKPHLLQLINWISLPQMCFYKRRTKRCSFEEISCGDRETTKVIRTRKMIRGCLSKDSISGKLLSAVKSTFCSPLFHRDNALMIPFMYQVQIPLCNFERIESLRNHIY